MNTSSSPGTNAPVSMISTIIQQRFVNQSIAIVGYGREGRSTTAFLLNHGIAPAQITVLDAHPHTDLPQGVLSITGETYGDRLDLYDVLVMSPGISPYGDAFAGYEDKMTSQTQLFFDLYQGQVVTITATKGKSTTASLLHHLCPGSKLVGNVGLPVLDQVDLLDPTPLIVFEISSYMLHRLKKSNTLGYVGMLAPDHLDRHKSLNEYYQTKINNLRHTDYQVINAKTALQFDLMSDYPHAVTVGSGGQYDHHEGYIRKDGEPLISLAGIQLLGQHNLENIAAAVAMADLLDIPTTTIQERLPSFTGLPHRLQCLGSHHGLVWYDDGMSTTPESTIAALTALGPQIGCLFLGGTDRGYNYHTLVSLVHQYQIPAVVLFPDTGIRIREMLDPIISVCETSSMETAVQFARDTAEAGSVVLLSTAAPSYTLRANGSKKGEEFVYWINKS